MLVRYTCDRRQPHAGRAADHVEDLLDGVDARNALHVVTQSRAVVLSRYHDAIVTPCQGTGVWLPLETEAHLPVRLRRSNVIEYRIARNAAERRIATGVESAVRIAEVRLLPREVQPV